MTDRASLDDLRNHMIKVKLRETLTGNPNLTTAQMSRIVDALDEVSLQDIFRELDDELKKMLSQGKRG